MRTLTALCLCCLLAGCSLGSHPEPAPAPPLSPLVQFMATHAKGDSTTLDDADFGSNITVTMLDAFTSAAGSVCRRASLLNTDGQSEIVVICRQQTADAPQWVMAPRIWGQGLGQPASPNR